MNERYDHRLGGRVLQGVRVAGVESGHGKVSSPLHKYPDASYLMLLSISLSKSNSDTSNTVVIWAVPRPFC